MKPAPGIPDWTPKPPRVAPTKKGPPWWAFLIAVAVVMGYIFFAAWVDSGRSHAPAPTAEQLERKRLEDQWESVVRERRQKEADFERRTRPR